MADSPASLSVLMAALMQQPAVKAAMGRVFEDVILYGSVRPETEARVMEAVKAAVAPRDVDRG